MTNAEFLRYCETHAETLRCGFASIHLARLKRLTGNEHVARLWDAEPNQVVDCDRDWILKQVEDGRRRILQACRP